MTDRRKFIKRTATGVAMAGLFPLSKQADAGENKITGALVHHVFFWLNEPENKVHQKQLIDALNQLIKVETIKMSHIGVPASTEERDVVDHSYSISYIAFFDSQKDQDIYQQHPIHLKFVEENLHLWKKVVVYDSTDLLD
jgi:hypothetical protein